MPSTLTQRPAFQLSICIPTFNRAAFIGATLESILVQVTNDCEVVVLDGGSTDNTEEVVSEYAGRFDNLRYVRQTMNNGFDRDCDRVVELARGEYCWLMPDDDLLKPGAVAAVLNALRRNPSLVIVNMDFMDFSMSKVLQSALLPFESDREYEPEEIDRLFAEVGNIVSYAGSVVVKRAIWLARERERYYGSWFIHAGVIFQEKLPGKALAIAQPCISYRTGNAHAWSACEAVLVKWPSFVTSLPLAESAKTKIYNAEPWGTLQLLLWLRGTGAYSLRECRRWIRAQRRSMREAFIPTFIALVPGSLINALLVFYCSVLRRRYLGMEPALVLQEMRESRFHFRNWQMFRPDSNRAPSG